MTDSTDKSYLLRLGSTVLVSVSITASTTVWFYENYRIPLKVVETTIEYKDISRKNEELEASIQKEKNSHDITKNTLSSTQLELGELNEKLLTQDLQIKELSQANLFYSDSFYPIGFGTPKIGDSVDSLKGLYKDTDIEWKNPAEEDWKVKLSIKNGYFQDIEYDFDVKTRKINGILFSSVAGNKKAMLKRLLEIGGQPTKSKKYDVNRWYVSKGVYSFLVSGSTYMILSNNQAPALWREPSEP
ncbi:hypothetical protein ACLUUI_18225 [Enterobacterales bacterium AW_CKDN230030176-1A_HGKHYDSX7]